MKTLFRRLGGVALGAGLCLISACNGSDGTTNSQPSTQKFTAYSSHYLVSDGAVPADHIDSNLKNPWGIAFNPSGPVWVANNATNNSTLYDGTGAAYPTPLLPLVFTVPAGSNGNASPTGIVFNATSSFTISQGTGLNQPASFIFSGEGGTIAAWTTTLLTNSVTEYDDGAGGAVYKGLALASDGGSNFLYATDFHNNKVDVFDGGFNKVSTTGGFRDTALPAGYAPFGIQNIAGNLVVTFAKQQTPDRHDEVDGAGLGFVDIFDPKGQLVKRLVSGGVLNAPWGIALAPADFGMFSKELLIGNFGDGLINAFDPATGAFLGRLRVSTGKNFQIDGLWGIAFGNDLMSQPHNTLFFTAGINDEADGVYGRIDPPM